MLPDLTLIQWAVLAGALALVIVPRLGALKTPLGFLAGIVRRPAPDVHAKVDACNELVVLMLDGWRASVGVAAEIAIARELGKPVTTWERAIG